uniref:Pco067871 n=1 Tax=Arundo donax TaxID=35708 RepID=A0A0A9F4Y2_ARUDO
MLEVLSMHMFCFHHWKLCVLWRRPVSEIRQLSRCVELEHR